MSQVSVVMVSYHTGPFLFSAIASVLAQDNLADFLLVDNGNPPDVIARVQQMSISNPRLKVITGHGNVGFAAGCNRGVAQAIGSYILLLNPDSLLPPGALVTFVRELEALPNTMLAGPRILNPDGSEQRGGRRELLTPKSALYDVLRIKKLNYNHSEMPSETHDVPAISGACMCIRKVDYDALGGMDEGYFLHVEDMDLCMRVARAGKRIVCIPSISVVHLLSTSGQVASDIIERYKSKGFVRYFEKYFGETLAAPIMFAVRSGIWLRYMVKKIWRSFPLCRHSWALNASRKLTILSQSLVMQLDPSALVGKTVVVTGATSAVGCYVVQRLLASGIAVLAISRDESIPFQHHGLKWLKADLTRDDFSLGGFLADVAINCAPQWHLPKIIPTLAASEVKRVLAIGSTSVFSKAASHNSFEKDLVFKHQRAEMEIARVCNQHQIQWTILRPTMIYGAGLDHNITSVARVIKRFGCFLVYPPAMGNRQPVHAEDVAIAAIQAVTSPLAVGQSYNISGAEIVGYRVMLERIFTTLKRPLKIIETSLLPSVFALAGMILRKKHITRDVALRMNDDLVFFHDDAKRDFGYQPRAFLSGGMKDIEGEIWHE